MSKQTIITTLFKSKKKEPPVDLINNAPELCPKLKALRVNDLSELSRESKLEVCLNRNNGQDQNQDNDQEQSSRDKSSLRRPSQEIQDPPDSVDVVQAQKDVIIAKDEPSSKSASKSSQAQKRKFQESWLNDYKGLRYDSENDLMTCEMCINFKEANSKASNIFVTGTDKKTTDVLNFHWKEHKGHQAAEKAAVASKKSKKIYDNMIIKNETKNLMMMKISYFLCKNAMSFNKFPELTDLIFHQLFPMITDKDKLCINITSHYKNDDMCVQFTEALSFIIERSITENILKSEYYSILIDESMDVSRQEQLLIYAKYFDSTDEQFKTSFLKIIPVANQSGAQLFLKIKNYFAEKRLDPKKCMAFGSDGAFNMTGYRKGVYSHLEKLNPFIMLRHCANHRLALAHSDTSKQVSDINEYIDTISDVYSFFSRSSRRNILLKKFQAEVMEPELNVLKLCPTRWLSLSRCVKNISKMYQSLVLTFDEELYSADSSLTTDSKDKYAKVFEKICDYKFLGLTYFFVDILSVVDNLCYELQSDSLNYGNYTIAVETCFKEIQDSYVDTEVYGENFQYFKRNLDNKEFLPHVLINKRPNTVAATHAIIKEFSKSLLQNLKTRFAVDETITQIQVLVIENIRSQEDVSLYGVEEIDKLLKIFGSDKTCNGITFRAVLDPIETRSEWRLFKRMMKNNYLNETNTMFWSRIIKCLTFKNQYPNI